VVGARAAAAKAAGARPGVPGRLTDGASGLRGAGEELRNRLRSERRLRMVTLVSLAVVVLVVLPVFFGLRTAVKDPVFSSLDALEVPSWAAEKVVDQGFGSRWCFLDCRFRERIAQSDRPFPDTTKAYTDALRAAGWQPWQVAECPEVPIGADQGTYSCWKRDEFTLDLWVRLPECAVDQVAAQDPAIATLPSPRATQPAGECVGSTVSIKVQNAIIDTRGEPENAERPQLGETPDPVLSEEAPGVPTPAAS
jgi:integrin beta 3